jgi:hypothetical protein
MTTKFSGIYYLSRDFTVLETKCQWVDIKISNITYHRIWFPFLKGRIHNETVLKDDQFTYMTYPRGLVVHVANDSFVIYGGNWLTPELSLRVLKEFGYEEKTVYKQVIVEEYHKYVKEV